MRLLYNITIDPVALNFRRFLVNFSLFTATKNTCHFVSQIALIFAESNVHFVWGEFSR